jgi:hypothetical protein
LYFNCCGWGRADHRCRWIDHGHVIYFVLSGNDVVHTRERCMQEWLDTSFLITRMVFRPNHLILGSQLWLPPKCNLIFWILWYLEIVLLVPHGTWYSWEKILY